jgi:hypothetical protein
MAGRTASQLHDHSSNRLRDTRDGFLRPQLPSAHRGSMCSHGGYGGWLPGMVQFRSKLPATATSPAILRAGSHRAAQQHPQQPLSILSDDIASLNERAPSPQCQPQGRRTPLSTGNYLNRKPQDAAQHSLHEQRAPQRPHERQRHQEPPQNPGAQSARSGKAAASRRTTI